jgi:hypothetical protein
VAGGSYSGNGPMEWWFAVAKELHVGTLQASSQFVIRVKVETD